MTAEWTHIPVMGREIAQALVSNPDGIYLDGTAGLGGHTALIAERLSDKGRVIGLDLDTEAIQLAQKNLEKFGGKAQFLEGNFADAHIMLGSLGISRIDGALLDLGLSSYQLDNPQRGFSFKNKAPLDMRFSKKNRLTASEIVNSWPQEQLAEIIRELGEDRFARRIAGAIVREREKEKIESTSRLREIIERLTPAKAFGRTNPATRTFQALRMAVNSELHNIENGIQTLEPLINPGGKIAVISFHSLEDRIVKHSFLKMKNTGLWKLAAKKPLYPSDEEMDANPRSRSAKLRIIERCA